MSDMQRLFQAHPPASSSQACVPIAAPCAPPQLQGAAVSAPPPASFLPAGMPPIPIQGDTSPVRGRPTSQHSNQGTRGRSVQNRPPHLIHHHLRMLHMTIQEMPQLHLRGCRRQAQHAGFVEDSMMKSTVQICP